MTRQLSGLYGQAYAAFRRRRSLLLLNLEHQVRFDELPWIAALQPFRADSADTARAARQALARSGVPGGDAVSRRPSCPTR